MSDRFQIISKLLTERSSRESYIRAKLNQLIPSQIRALRLREEWTQKQLSDESGMKQARISAMESPGEVNFSLETLIRIASTFKVGLWVQFVSHLELVQREWSYSQDHFAPLRLPEDRLFLEPPRDAVLVNLADVEKLLAAYREDHRQTLRMFNGIIGSCQKYVQADMRCTTCKSVDDLKEDAFLSLF